MVISVINQKGGVGKTTVSINLAVALAMRNTDSRVLLIDADSQANTTTAVLGAKKAMEYWEMPMAKRTIGGVLVDDIPPQETILTLTNNRGVSLDILPSSLYVATSELELMRHMNGAYAMRIATKPLVREYDFIIVDSSPSMGRMFMNVVLASDALIIPVNPSEFARIGFDLIVDAINGIAKQSKRDIKILGSVLNMTRRTKDTDRAREALGQLNVPIITEIPLRAKIERCVAAGIDSEGEFGDVFSDGDEMIKQRFYDIAAAVEGVVAHG